MNECVGNSLDKVNLYVLKTLLVSFPLVIKL